MGYSSNRPTTDNQCVVGVPKGSTFLARNRGERQNGELDVTLSN